VASKRFPLLATKERQEDVRLWPTRWFTGFVLQAQETRVSKAPACDNNVLSPLAGVRV
jgi:hypothetical protein